MKFRRKLFLLFLNSITCQCPSDILSQFGSKITANTIWYEDGNSATAGMVPKCIYAFGHESDVLNYTMARQWCASNLVAPTGARGDLLSIHSAEENQHIGNQIKTGQKCVGESKPCNERRYWIGLNKHCKHCDFGWTDFSPYDFQAFEPDAEIGLHECAYIDTYDERHWWQDNSCYGSYRFICQLVPDGPGAELPDYEQAPGGCDQGWWEYHGTCYRTFGSNLTGRPETHSNEIATQQQAIAKCDSLGGQLAIFPNRYHNDFASSFVYAEGDSPWIGVTSDTDQGLRYMWYDKRRLTYTNWQAGYPEQGTGKKCVKMWYFSSTSGGWDLGNWENRPCGETRPFICSKNADPGKPRGNSFYNPFNCPEGWIPHESNCFKYINTPTSFDAAQANCQSFSDGDWVGNVMTVWNVYQQRLLNSFFNADEVATMPPNTMWLGLKVKSSKDGGSLSLTWIDGMYDAFTNFALGEPSILTEDTCFLISAKDQLGQWYATMDCNSPKPYVCKLEQKSALPDWSNGDARGDVIPCNDPWKTFVGARQGTWSTVEGLCQELDYHSHLVAIHSDSYNSHIQNMARDAFGEASRIWIGAERYTNGDVDQFKWSNNDGFAYSNWAQGEPNDWNDRGEDCVSMYIQNGKWNDDICSSNYHGVCMKRAQQENCIVESGEQRDYCGYPGISEQECWSQFQCCYYHNRCYYPKGHSKPKNGLTPGGAAALTFFMFLAFVFLPISFYLYKKNGINLSNPF